MESRSIGNPADAHALSDMKKTRLLLVDDDAEFVDQLSAYLSQHGFATRCLLEVSALAEVLASYAPALVILDQRLGDVTGTEVLKYLRERSDVPCIILTGCSDAFDRIVNLEVGADDEVQKSVAPREVLARIRSVLRRARGNALSPSAAPPIDNEQGWRLDKGRRALFAADGQPCRLTTAEYETLVLLHDNRSSPVSRDLISQHVFRRPWREGDRAVDTVIKKLRRKIEPTPDEPESIKTVRQLGYVFVDFPAGEGDR
jgi:DNA-binding response OmpR family regulator